MSNLDIAIRFQMNISTLFRTKYEGDLDEISMILGSEYSKIIPNLPVDYSNFHLADADDPFILA